MSFKNLSWSSFLGSSPTKDANFLELPM